MRKQLILPFILLILFFIWITYCISSILREKQQLEIELQNIKKQNEVFSKKDKEMSESISHIETNYYLLIEKVSLIEETLNTKNYKFTQMTKIRRAVYNSVGENLRVKFNIFDLTDIANSVLEYSKKYDVPVSLILAMIRQESAFNKTATSRVGATGLMQIMPYTADEIAKDVGKKNHSMTSITDNVQFGTYYIRKMLRKYGGDVSLAVKAYNAGPDYVDKVKTGIYSTFPRETVDYHEKILFYKQQYENLGL